MQLRSLLIKACLLFASLAVVGAPVAPAQSSQATPTPAARRTPQPFPPTQYIPPHNYDQRNIRLDLRFDWEQEQAIGTATITLAPIIKDLRRVDFDAAYMTISGATLSSGPPLKWEYDANKENLSILLDRAYQPAEEL